MPRMKKKTLVFYYLFNVKQFGLPQLGGSAAKTLSNTFNWTSQRKKKVFSIYIFVCFVLCVYSRSRRVPRIWETHFWFIFFWREVLKVNGQLVAGGLLRFDFAFWTEKGAHFLKKDSLRKHRRNIFFFKKKLFVAQKRKHRRNIFF